MDTVRAKDLKKGDEVFFAGAFFKVHEIKQFPHGLMIGIYDVPPSDHVGYLNPSDVSEVIPCYACQGGGCPVCGGYGRIVQ